MGHADDFADDCPYDFDQVFDATRAFHVSEKRAGRHTTQVYKRDRSFSATKHVASTGRLQFYLTLR